MSNYWWGSDKQYVKPQVEKIKPKIVPMVGRISDYKDKFSSAGYYSSCKALINQINEHFGWEREMMFIREYEKHYDEIVKFILDHYTIRDTTQLGAKMAHLIYVMKLMGHVGQFDVKQKGLYLLNINQNPKQRDYDSWDKMLERIEQEMNCVKSLGGFMILLCYKHGYPLRIGDIVSTSINPTEDFNHLDLDNRVWNILAARTKNRRARSFEVTQEFCDDVRKYIHSSGYLVCRNNGQPYKSLPTMYLLGVEGLKVVEMRNSYETWNYARTDISDDEKCEISKRVLGHSPATARAYYTPLVNDLQKSIEH